jgi:hypothetical protein
MSASRNVDPCLDPSVAHSPMQGACRCISQTWSVEEEPDTRAEGDMCCLCPPRGTLRADWRGHVSLGAFASRCQHVRPAVRRRWRAVEAGPPFLSGDATTRGGANMRDATPHIAVAARKRRSPPGLRRSPAAGAQQAQRARAINLVESWPRRRPLMRLPSRPVGLAAGARCGLADQTKVTVAWPSRNMLETPHQRSP